MRTEKRGWVPRQIEREQGVKCLMRTEFPFREDEDSSGDG